MSILKAENLSKTYGNEGNEVAAVNGVSLDVRAGEVVLIMGPSGSGKTTLLLLLGTLLRGSTGTVVVGGNDTNGLSKAELSRLRLKEIGFVFQHFNLLSALTAEQNVQVPLLAGGIPKQEAQARARKLLASLGLGKRAGSLPENLSGGEKQRVAIARAMANDPGILLADEPTANLDAKTGREVVEVLCGHAKENGKAVLIVSHDPRIRDVADRVILMEDGKIVAG